MFINKLNQLYKPQRILYYLDATDDDIRDFYNGTLSEKISGFTNAFGTTVLESFTFQTMPTRTSQKPL